MGVAYIDNDILHKLSGYGLLRDLLGSRPLDNDNFLMLGAARYIVSKKLQKKAPVRGAELAIAEFEAALANIATIEPSDEEVKLASEFEYAAQQLNVDFDPGESLLCAALLQRGEGYPHESLDAHLPRLRFVAEHFGQPPSSALSSRSTLCSAWKCISLRKCNRNSQAWTSAS